MSNDEGSVGVEAEEATTTDETAAEEAALSAPPARAVGQAAAGDVEPVADPAIASRFATGSPMPRLGLVAIIVAAIAVSLWLMQSLSSTIAPMFLALNLLIAAFPIYTGLTRIKVPKGIAAVVTMLAVFVVLIIGIGAMVWSVTQVVGVLTQHTDQFVTMYTAAIQWLAQFGLDQDGLLNSLKSISPSNVLDFAGGILSSTSAASGIVAVMVVGIVFMTMDIPSVKERLGITSRTQPGLTDSLAAVASGIRRYWVVTTVFGLIVALINGGIIAVLGVSLPLVWIVLTFITNYIPNIGFVIGLIPPALLALVEKGPATALIVVIAFCVVNFILQSLIQPRFTGNAVGITPIVSFFSLLVWAWVFGPLGALIALPATLTVKALLIDPDPKTRWLNAFISNEPKSAEG